MSQVWDSSPLEGRALLIELALADFASDEGACYPSIATIARKGRCSESWVHQVIRDLVKRGRVDVLLGGGRGKANVYIMKPDAGEKGVLKTPFSELKGAVDSAERVHSDEKRVHSTAPDPSYESSIEPSIHDMADEALPFEPKGTVTVVFMKEMIALYPNLDVPSQHEQYDDHWLAHPKNKPKNDQAGFRNWLRKAEGWRNERDDKASRGAPAPATRGQVGSTASPFAVFGS